MPRIFRICQYAVLTFLLATPVNAQVVVVSSDISQPNVTLSSLRAIFGMRLHIWPDGTPIRVFVFESSREEHIKFCKKILNLYPYQLQRAWDRLVFSGTGQAPNSVTSIAEMQQKIATTPGAIGYLPENSVKSQFRQLNVMSNGF